MALKYGDSDSIKRTKETIDYYNNLIHQVKSIKNGSPDAVKSGMETIRELEYDCGVKKDLHLKLGTDRDFILAHGLQRMQEAYQTVITMFESPSQMISSYENEIQIHQEWLKRHDPGQVPKQ